MLETNIVLSVNNGWTLRAKNVFHTSFAGTAQKLNFGSLENPLECKIVWRMSRITAVCGATWEVISVLFQQQFKRNDLSCARRGNFLCFLMHDKDSVIASFLIIYEIRKIKKIFSMQCAFCASDTLILWLSFFGDEVEFFLWWKQFLMLDRNEIIFFLSTFVGCFMSFLQCERGFHLAMFCSFFLWKHLLRRFTDCAQLGFSSSSTFWFSASDAQECIRNCCRGSEKSLSFPRDVLCNFFLQQHIKPI